MSLKFLTKLLLSLPSTFAIPLLLILVHGHGIVVVAMINDQQTFSFCVCRLMPCITFTLTACLLPADYLSAQLASLNPQNIHKYVQFFYKLVTLCIYFASEQLLPDSGINHATIMPST